MRKRINVLRRYKKLQKEELKESNKNQYHEEKRKYQAVIKKGTTESWK
jgi:hypothetical protein